LVAREKIPPPEVVHKHAFFTLAQKDCLMSIEQYRARVQRLVSRRFGRKEASAGELLRF